MNEVRHRLDFLLQLHERQWVLPPLPASELGYLELRMICETVALACLVVHGDDIPVMNARMRGSYQADFILNALERLHPTFYPEPGLPMEAPSGGRMFLSRADAYDYMTKAELLKLYFECGSQLHRGAYESMGELPDPSSLPIRTATLRFIALLRFHRIAFLGTNDVLWVAMTDPKTGNVRATLERPFSD
jgi:hypothetical protein